MDILKTSQEWQEIFYTIKVADPDGWDRKNFQYSWHEERITREEYNNRIEKSTVMINKERYNATKKEDN